MRKNSDREWSVADDFNLRFLVGEGLANDQIAADLRRSVASVAWRRTQLGIDRTFPWTEGLDLYLKSKRSEGATVSEIRRVIGCSRSVLYERMKVLRLSRRIRRPVKPAPVDPLTPIATAIAAKAVEDLMPRDEQDAKDWNRLASHLVTMLFSDPRLSIALRDVS